ncbi:hypothetical protein V1477_012278 [Vespula maculifrons]|uniref:Uncharacterized protein n=1 Tax=Vespula maculifrons TaxID=7453 RepID=A0ABD2BX13_VESMC
MSIRSRFPFASNSTSSQSDVLKLRAAMPSFAEESAGLALPLPPPLLDHPHSIVGLVISKEKTSGKKFLYHWLVPTLPPTIAETKHFMIVEKLTGILASNKTQGMISENSCWLASEYLTVSSSYIPMYVSIKMDACECFFDILRRIRIRNIEERRKKKAILKKEERRLKEA